MPLTVPPDVRIGTDPTWRPTAFDTGTTAVDVARGRDTLTARDVQYLRWTVALNNDPPQVIRLLVAGPSVTAPGIAVVVPVGRHATKIRVTDTPEVIELDTGAVEVTV